MTRMLDLGERLCAGCGERLVRREREDARDWRKRRFCQASCYWTGLRRPAPVTPDVPVDWDRAACRGQDDIAWWTDTGRDADEVERLRDLARWHCAGCPLRDACETRGRTEKFGLYGGVLWRSVGGRRVALDLLGPAERIEVAS